MLSTDLACDGRGDSLAGDSVRRVIMKENGIRERAFAMPLTSPAYPPGPYRFIDRKYLIITYRTDPQRLRAVVPEPLVHC
jgi:hypothetical protein